jgi:hypothetical protein
VTRGKVQVTFDCADPVALGRFWAEVLRYPQPDVEAYQARLRAEGEPVRRARRPPRSIGRGFRRILLTLQDPEGNEFCID